MKTVLEKCLPAKKLVWTSQRPAGNTEPDSKSYYVQESAFLAKIVFHSMPCFGLIEVHQRLKFE